MIGLILDRAELMLVSGEGCEVVCAGVVWSEVLGGLWGGGGGEVKTALHSVASTWGDECGSAVHGSRLLCQEDVQHPPLALPLHSISKSQA